VALPQVNTDEFIGSFAGFTGVNLADVVRAAYVDIVKRLVQFYGFTQKEAYLLVCQTARVRVGQIVDPLYCAAVTIERRYIA
jgi:acetamidase/formamidase